MTKILIAEDEALVAQNIKHRCEMLGYKVPMVVASGEEVLPAVQQCEPDLILMDIRLRGAMDGITAAQQVRAQRDIPIVYLTAYVDDETIERAKLTEPYGYIVKPFSFADMRATIEIVVHRHKMDVQRAAKKPAE